MKSCPCQEHGRDGTRQHGEVVALISGGLHGDGFFVCHNHIRNYEESILRYGMGAFGGKKVQYFDKNFDSAEIRTQTKWSF